MMNKTKLAVAVLGLALAGVASAATLTYNGSPFAIPDVATNSGTIAVPAGDWGGRDTVRDVDCAVRLRHTWDSDITVDLKSSEGTNVTLWARQGGSSDNFNVIIDDEAATNMGGWVNDGSRRRPQTFPAQSMCFFDGAEPGGSSFTLEISDLVGGDSGNVDAWSVTIEGEQGRFDSCGGDAGGGGHNGIGSLGKTIGIAPRGQHGDKAR